ncbi:MAG: ARC6/PARC6 family protein, partial [Cyanobacteria bacterium J06648_11]
AEPELTEAEKLIALLTTSGPLNDEGALAAIQEWQDAKHAAMGGEYDTAALDGILADPMLANWTARSQSNQQQGARLDYTLNNLTLESVEPQGDDRASAVVEIDEVRDYFVGDTRYDEYSSASVYRVRYDLIRRDDGQWVVSSYVLL